FFFSAYAHTRYLHSFPTRRSSDLAVVPRLTVVLLRELFSIVTFILILVMSPSRMTVGTTSSLSTASLNWICVPAELTVAYGISSPSEIEAVPFSTVTTSGRASVRVLLSRRSASSARLTLYRLPVMPNAMPPAPPPETAPPPSAPLMGRLTRLPPSGRDRKSTRLNSSH